MTVVFSPFIGQIGRAEPYISNQELEFSATASALDLDQLVPNGTQTAQDRALYELILRASAKIDAHCMGRMGTLNATSFTQNGRYRMDRQGRFKIHPSYTPVLAVSSFSWGSEMGNMTPLVLTSANVWPEEESIIINPAGTTTTTTFSGPSTLSWLFNDNSMGEFYTEFTYINGWPNTFTSASVASGATSIPVTDPTGIYPGNSLQVWDGMNDEWVQVSSTYVPGTPTVTLTNPLSYAHGKGINVSMMHPNVKQACILFVCSMVRERGQGGGFEISPTGEVVQTSGKSSGFTEDELQAYDLLDEFKQISGRM